MKYTPGPWSIHKHSSTSVVGSNGLVVASCGSWGNNLLDPEAVKAEQEATARLIAAAPELLVLARFVIDHPRAASGRGDREHLEWTEMQRLAKEVIKKADGQ